MKKKFMITNSIVPCKGEASKWSKLYASVTILRSWPNKNVKYLMEVTLIQLISMGLDDKTCFGVSDKEKLKPVSSATEIS